MQACDITMEQAKHEANTDQRLILHDRWWEARIIWGGMLGITKNIMRQASIPLMV